MEEEKIKKIMDGMSEKELKNLKGILNSIVQKIAKTGDERFIFIDNINKIDETIDKLKTNIVSIVDDKEKVYRMNAIFNNLIEQLEQIEEIIEE